MNRNQLVELLKYASPFSILVITYNNKLVELKCPFTVIVMHNVGGLFEGNIEQVDMVKLSFDLKTVFIIKEDAYFYFHFEILID